MRNLSIINSKRYLLLLSTFIDNGCIKDLTTYHSKAEPGPLIRFSTFPFVDITPGIYEKTCLSNSN